MRARDLLAFARMHICGGMAADGTTVLSAASVKAMQEPQVKLPPVATMGDRRGLGWEMFDWPGGAVIGHDGGTIGQAAFLRIVPERDVAIALLTNGGDGIAVYTRVYRHLLGELAGVEMPAMPVPSAEPAPIDASRYVGTYSCDVADMIVTQDQDGRVWVDQVPKGAAEMLVPPERHELIRLYGDTFVTADPGHGLHRPHVFVGNDDNGRSLLICTTAGRSGARPSYRPAPAAAIGSLVQHACRYITTPAIPVSQPATRRRR